jgi:hypothetical protein
VKKIFALAVSFLIPSFSLLAQLITSHDALFMPELSQPAQGNAVTDPVFGTQIRRLSNAIVSGNLGIAPQYSKRQAWNCNDSLILMLNCEDGYFSLYDGQTYQFIRGLMDPVVGGEDVFWHPAQKNTIIYTDSIIYSYNVVTNERTSLHVFTDYTYVNTKGEGNLSYNGRYYAFVGQVYNYGTGETFNKDIVVYDMQEDQVIATMPVSHAAGSGDIDWMSISPLGDYVVIDYSDWENGRHHGVEVYDRNLNFLWQVGLGAGHSDLGIDQLGNEIIIKDVYDGDLNITHFRKYRLSDGAMTNLLDVSPDFDQHISLRNIDRRGWCFISTFDYVGRLTDNEASWLPFEDEIFALKLDGSGDVERICHHHSRRYFAEDDPGIYWAEPHATVNRLGTKVIWGSNWRHDMGDVQSVDAYLCDFSGLLGIEENGRQGDKGTGGHGDPGLMIYPNPVSDLLTLDFILDQPGDVHETITDISGKLILSQSLEGKQGDNRVTTDISLLMPGIYLVRIQSPAYCYISRFIRSR